MHTKKFPRVDLIVHNQNGDRRKYSLEPHYPLVLGCDQLCEILISRKSNPYVSERHCSFEVQAAAEDDFGGIEIKDLGGANGTKIDQNTIRHGNNSIKLQNLEDTEVRAGNTTVRFEYQGEYEVISYVDDSIDRFGGIVGNTPIMKKLYFELENAAKCSTPVLLLGETGTGKTEAASAIHKQWAVHQRKAKDEAPFITFRCGITGHDLAVSDLFGHVKNAYNNAQHRKGAIEEADGGTLFIDEIGELTPETQVKFLHFLNVDRASGICKFQKLGQIQESQATVRIIAATNRDLKKLVRLGHFREDLYYRLDGIQIKLPPLRVRLDDLSLLIGKYLETYSTLASKQDSKRQESQSKPKRETFEKSKEQWLKSFQKRLWPGNVRQLFNTLVHCITFGTEPREIVAGQRLPQKTQKETISSESDIKKLLSLMNDMPLKEAIQEFKKMVVLHRYHNKNKSLKDLAKSLNTPIPVVERWIQDFEAEGDA